MDRGTQFFSSFPFLSMCVGSLGDGRTRSHDLSGTHNKHHQAAATSLSSLRMAWPDQLCLLSLLSGRFFFSHTHHRTRDKSMISQTSAPTWRGPDLWRRAHCHINASSACLPGILAPRVMAPRRVTVVTYGVDPLGPNIPIGVYL